MALLLCLIMKSYCKRKKIDHSVSSFAKAATEPGDEGYLFVLEDTETGEVVAPQV